MLDQVIIVSASHVIEIIRAYIAQYNTLLGRVNTLHSGGIKSSIFKTKNKLMGILRRLRTKSPNCAIAVPVGYGVSKLIKTLGK